jgi:hypothetical protein
MKLMITLGIYLLLPVMPVFSHPAAVPHTHDAGDPVISDQADNLEEVSGATSVN